MSNEKVLMISDSIQGPTGFAIDAQGIAWSLAEDYDVHVLGLQSFRDEIVPITLHGETREIKQLANTPREPGMKVGRDYMMSRIYDFGTKSLPRHLAMLQPEMLITINDIQMIQHIPKILFPTGVNLQVMDLPSKDYISDDTIKMQLDAEVQKYKEIYPMDMKWLAYCPQDGDPPMQDWKSIYLMADKIVAMSKYGQELYKNFYNMDVPYIWHGVDTDVFKPMEIKGGLEKYFVVGDLNRNQPRKNVVRLMEAFSKFSRDKKDVLLHLQKNWNDEFGWPLQYYVKLFGLTGKLINPKPVNLTREQVAKVYNMWDVNMMPTGGEGFGLCTIEGLACGKPCIHTDYTTGRELLIDGQPGPRGALSKVAAFHWDKMDVAAVRRSLPDIDDMVNKLNAYYYNRDVCKQHGENGRKWTEKNVSWKKISKHWLKTVKNTLNE